MFSGICSSGVVLPEKPFRYINLIFKVITKSVGQLVYLQVGVSTLNFQHIPLSFLNSNVNNGNLFLRCNEICKSHGLSLSRYIFDEHYVKRCKTLLYSETCDGVADTICTLLTNYN